MGQHKGFRRTRKKPRQPKLTGLPRYSSSTTSSRSIGRSLPFARAVPLTLAALRLGRSDLLLPAARPFLKERRHSSLTRVQSSSKHSSLEAVIDTEGKVENVKVLRFVEGFPSLTEAAIKALEQWRYLPAMENGRPVKTSLTVVMEFFPAPATPEGIEALERLARRAMPMSLFFTDEPIGRVFDAIEQASGIRVVGKDILPADIRVTLRTCGTLKEVLWGLAGRHHLRYEVRDPETVVVIRETEPEDRTIVGPTDPTDPPTDGAEQACSSHR